jgi:FHA domain-containing protein
VLLAAFQRGLGMPIYAHGGLTPERMEQLGVVVREAVSGTMGLLKARATTKREFRADMTMIVSRENNPLKFAPDIEFALFQLLEPKGGGFLAAEPAMRDAYLDLRSHQFGFLAGMRAAIGGLIQRFKPEVLEQRISRGGFLASVLPGARKARLWDLYEQHYAAISREAEDDFDALFGREFLKAYEEQIERLRDEAEDQ